MVRSWSDMNQGSRSGEERRSWPLEGPEEPCPEGDRVSVVNRCLRLNQGSRRPYGTRSVHNSTRQFLPGYFQQSLRDKEVYRNTGIALC